MKIFKCSIKIAGFSLFLILYYLLFRRAFMSVELTDEIHGIASVYNAYLGKVPLMTSWDYHIGYCLLVPLIQIWHFIRSSFEGIVIFFRLTYLLFAISSSLIIIMLIHNRFHIDSRILIFLCCPFIVSASIFQIGYNSFTVYVLMIVTVMIISSKEDSLDSLRYFGIGILMGLGCIMYPTLVVMAILLTAYIAIRSRLDYRKKRSICYICGGILIASLFLFYIFSQGSLSLFLQALKGIIASPHELSKGRVNFSYIRQVFYYPLKLYFLRPFTVIIVAYIIFELLITKKNEKKLYLCKYCGVIFFLVLNTYFNYRINNDGYMILGIWLATIILVLGMDIQYLKKYSIVLWMVPAFVITYCFTSDNRSIITAFSASGPLVCGLFCLVCCLDEKCKKKYCIIAVSFIIAVSGLARIYTYVYRDAALNQLVKQVDSGIYKGLYTTESRKNLVERMENVLIENVQTTDSICAVTRAPAVYLMARAHICAPQTWDAQFLYRGYTSADPLLDYFSAVNEYPDILVATDMDIPDFYDNPKYEINTFISQYYDLYYSEEIEGDTIYLWRRK